MVQKTAEILEAVATFSSEWGRSASPWVDWKICYNTGNLKAHKGVKPNR